MIASPEIRKSVTTTPVVWHTRRMTLTFDTQQLFKTLSSQGIFSDKSAALHAALQKGEPFFVNYSIAM
ncbi:MAG: hypothetical protein MI861_01390, partial [Pirellulales bacterium]|nr:hypothetical protein [Pirellulales bacterium]